MCLERHAKRGHALAVILLLISIVVLAVTSHIGRASISASTIPSRKPPTEIPVTVPDPLIAMGII